MDKNQKYDKILGTTNNFPYLSIDRIVSIGAVFALCTNLLGSMFPLPRILYAMSSDGLLFGVFKQVNTRTKTPLNATLLAGAFAAVMSMVFDLHQLIDMCVFIDFFFAFKSIFFLFKLYSSLFFLL